MEYIENKISSFIATTAENTNILVNTLSFATIDGKNCKAVSENTSTLRCCLCGLISNNFNKIDLVEKSGGTENKYSKNVQVSNGFISGKPKLGFGTTNDCNTVNRFSMIQQHQHELPN